jgi:hypothetical protein
MSPAHYKDMISALNLSYRQIESRNSAKAFFWSVTCHNDENYDDQHLRESIVLDKDSGTNLEFQSLSTVTCKAREQATVMDSNWS